LDQKKIVVKLVVGSVSGFQPDEATPINLTPGRCPGLYCFGLSALSLTESENISQHLINK